MSAHSIPVAVFVLGLAGSAVAQTTVVPGPSHPVKVTNDTASPVPVQLAEGAVVSGTVTVANTAGNPVPVSIEGAPVPVVVLGDSINEPYVGSEWTLVDEPDFSDIASFNLSFDIPEGKRLIVESVSLLVTGSLGADFEAGAVLQRGIMQVGIPLQRGIKAGAGTTGIAHAGMLPLKLRLDGHTSISIHGRLTGLDQYEHADVRASLFGYLVPLPE